MITTTCDNCGVSCLKSNTDYNRSKNHYCSVACRTAARCCKVNVECNTCGVLFKCRPSQTKAYAMTFKDVVEVVYKVNCPKCSKSRRGERSITTKGNVEILQNPVT